MGQPDSFSLKRVSSPSFEVCKDGIPQEGARVPWSPALAGGRGPGRESMIPKEEKRMRGLKPGSNPVLSWGRRGLSSSFPIPSPALLVTARPFIHL